MKVFSSSKWLAYAWESLYTDGKWSSQRLYDFGFSRRFVLVRVWYLSSSEAYTNNWGLFGKENYLTFDWWKHFLKILRRSEVTINLTRRMGAKWVRPLVVLYSIFFLFFSDAPSPCGLIGQYVVFSSFPRLNVEDSRSKKGLGQTIHPFPPPFF